MMLCYGDGKRLDLRSPYRRSFSVDAFPAEREAADPIKQAAERRALRKKRRHSTEHPAPERERDGVSERFVLRRVCFLVYAALYRGRTSSPVRPMLLSCSLISLTIRICSMYKPERAPARPARFPAMLKSWQGLPPVMHQTGVISAPLIFVISPKCLMKIASLSECHQHYRALSSGML